MGFLDELEEGTPDIFRDKSALRHNTTPDELIGREEEKEAIARELLDIRHGEEPENVFVFGQNGVGKTAVTTYVLEEFENDDNAEIDIQTLRVNCETVNKSHQLGAKVANQLLGFQRYNPDNTGVQKGATWETAFKTIEEHGGATLLCLDEIDSIKDLDDTLYKLGRHYNYLDEAVLGFVCISTDASILSSIDNDTSSSLSESSVSFSPYDSYQLVDLLRHRAEKAFYDGVVTEAAIKKAAALGAKAEGDAREALDLLRGAGNIASQQGAEQVRVEHVGEQKEKLERNEVFQILTQELKRNHRLTACALLAAQMYLNEEYDESSGTRDRTSPRTNEIYAVYREIDSDPLSRRQFRTHLDLFDDVNLTNRKSNGTQGGGDNHELTFDTKDVHETLSDFINENITTVETAPEDMEEEEAWTSDALWYLTHRFSFLQS
jgi:cell division control protein 6